MPRDLPELLSEQLQKPPPSIVAALQLLDEGATIPFIARYRKERTGGLDEVQLRAIADAQRTRGELVQRHDAIVKALEGAGQLSPRLREQLGACETRADLEEVYAPFKKRRKTRADQARERGLAPLAERMRAQADRGDPFGEAAAFVRPEQGVPSAEDALAGARDIVAERLAAEPGLRALVRREVEQGDVTASASRAQRAKEGADRFRDYVDHTERAARVPSHRYLAMCRGEAEGLLTVKVRPDVERTLHRLLHASRWRERSPWAGQVRQATEDALKRLLLPAAERHVRAMLKERADDEAIEVFQRNLQALLLGAPLGPQAVLGVDPGLRTGCKCALVAASGALEAHRVLHLVGRRSTDADALVRWLEQSRPAAVAVGNGTGGREALQVVREAIRASGQPILAVAVDETGASVYSASEVAREELPDVDLTVRSAAHIARRLQDPLAELVKVPPASLGVGQYQHDVDGGKLARKLEEVVESCVNRVGVNVNTASSALLAYVAGIGPGVARHVVAHREAHGAFASRKALREVRGLGAKTFEQCAGFLRIPDGAHPLDASAVHPERYSLVAEMAKSVGRTVADLVGAPEVVRRVDVQRFAGPEVGSATLGDIVEELARPGRDPRADFEAPRFRDDVRELEDLREGMVLEGVVTNVTNFGAFVDVGVHQDGLVHISELADRYVATPHEVVQAHQRVQVRVLGVDTGRRRISLSIRQA